MPGGLRTADFDFHLPEQLIALRPAEPRKAARLLVVGAEGLEDRRVGDLPDLLRAGDVLVFNDTRVIPARLRGERVRPNPQGSPVAVELTLLKREAPDRWTAFAKPGRRLQVGDAVRIFCHPGRSGAESRDPGGAGAPAPDAAVPQRVATLGPGSGVPPVRDDRDMLLAEIAAKHDDGQVALRFDRSGADLDAAIAAAGDMPLPPYIAARRAPDDRDRADYQTAYARVDGSVAAPTAGLHFTPDLLARLEARGVERAFVTLHVGAGTFLPVKVEDLSQHVMHAETGEVTAATASRLNAASARGGRIVCVGTTSLRLLESATTEAGEVRPFAGETDIFITPGHRFRAADGLVTNFHLPRSTLLMLVSAFAGMAQMGAAYAHAVRHGYRFYSYGDASLLWRAEEG